MKKIIIIGGVILLVVVGLVILFYTGHYTGRNVLPKELIYTPVASVTTDGARVGIDQVKVAVPANALPLGTKVEAKKVSAQPALSTSQHYVSDVYEIETNVSLSAPVVIEIAFDPNKVPNDKINNLFAAYYENEKWVPAPNGMIDLSRNVVMVTTDHFSLWAALYDAASGIWEDRIDDAYWVDVPNELQSQIWRDLKMGQGDFKAILRAQFSSSTKGSTFVFGIANQMVNVSGILGGLESGGELAKAVVEKVVEDGAVSQGGEVGEMAVSLYETGKTGLAVGTALGSMAINLTFKTAEVQAALPQVLGWILEKEMAYFNANTSGLFEYLSLYDSGWGQRIDTYILFYDRPVQNRLRERGVVLYYWSPQYKKWIKGKDIGVILDVVVKAFETAVQKQVTQSVAPTSKAPSFSKNKYPPSLLGHSLVTSEINNTPVGCLEEYPPLEGFHATYGNVSISNVGDMSAIIVDVNKFTDEAAAQKGPQKCVEWGARTFGVREDLIQRDAVLGAPFWVTYGPFNGQSRALSGSQVVVGNYLITITINTPSAIEANHQEIAKKIISVLKE